MPKNTEIDGMGLRLVVFHQRVTQKRCIKPCTTSTQSRAGLFEATYTELRKCSWLKMSRLKVLLLLKQPLSAPSISITAPHPTKGTNRKRSPSLLNGSGLSPSCIDRFKCGKWSCDGVVSCYKKKKTTNRRHLG